MDLVDFIRPFSTLLIYFFLHDVVFKKIYCKWKHKFNKTKYKCYYWNCKKWHDCPLNISDKTIITEFIESIRK